MFTVDGSNVKDDGEREASLSPGFSCLGCHNDSPDDGVADKTLAQAAAGAKNMHVVTSITAADEIAPRSYELSQNYPNPFNPETKIEFSLMEQGFTQLVVYNMSGQVVSVLVEENMNAGQHTINFDGSNLPSGVNFYSITSENFRDSIKMILLK